ncbi:ATP-grasp domain-containing protein [Rhodococcus jostii]|uniref:ATP-grasp domain-containing protein n=1 Tax=Rhodococcus jostii TaxID=132919 RepID=A0ABU4CHC3_RHOJO|nr:ATP-grasp domain-containing protein [Rhodococcus jostii]MDV6282935.1 ATP-grasp domain-containing protein [Rhodococcus jostii]
MPRATESAAMPWLRRVGLATPELVVVTHEHELLPGGPAFGPPWVVKPDVAGSGKGLAGLVHICRSRDELSSAVTATLRSGAPAVVEEFVEGEECYLSIALDETTRGAVVRAAATGGVGFDAHQAAAMTVGLAEGPDDHAVAGLLDRAAVSDPRLRSAIGDALQVLWTAFCSAEAVLVEVNPFRWDGQRLVAVGVAVEFDPHGHPDAQALRPSALVDADHVVDRAPTPRELAVREADAAEPNRAGIKFFELDGDVACMITGGGAGLLALDYLTDLGIRPACYLDASPGAGSAKLQTLFSSALSVPGLRGVLFGGAVLSLADARDVAVEFAAAADRAGFDSTRVPTVVRLAGPHEAEAHAVLRRRLPGALVLDRAASLEDACDLLLTAMEQSPQELEGLVR